MLTYHACSHCHTQNPTTDVSCRTCGHDAHVPRALCRCQECAPAQKPAAVEVSDARD